MLGQHAVGVEHALGAETAFGNHTLPLAEQIGQKTRKDDGDRVGAIRDRETYLRAGAADAALLDKAARLLPRVRDHFDVQAIHLGIEALWSVLADTNRYISSQEPWKSAKTDLERTATVLYVCAEVVRVVALLSQPVMPESANRILDLLAVDPERRQFTAVDDRLVAGTSLPAPSPVFPRYEA